MTAERKQEAHEVDLQEVGRLVDALEKDLDGIAGSSPDIQRLRDEVQTLKSVLDSPVRHPHRVKDGLHSIREGIEAALDSAVAQGVKPGQYIAEIGRILGL